MRRLVWSLAVVVLLVWPANQAAAQAPGYAEITAPSDGATLDGLISIQGSADHPAFLRYELAFAYDPNPTGTWFPIGEPVDTRGRQARLGLWDTSELAPGVYQLRLRVFLEGGAILEDTLTGLRVGLPAPPGEPTQAAARSTATPVPSPTAPAQPAPAAATAPPGDPMVLALGIGGFMAAALLVILAAYLPLRRSLALWGGNLRMRRVLRQDVQRRRGDPNGS